MAVIVVMELSLRPLNRPYSPHIIHSNTYTTAIILLYSNEIKSYSWYKYYILI